MIRQIAAGIDIGTHQVKVIVAAETVENGKVSHSVIGRGVAESRGLSAGYIVNPTEVAMAVSQALALAEKAAGVKVKRAFVAMGGIGLTGITTTGSTVITRADLEITERDKDKALEVAESLIPPAQILNRKIINIIPVEYKADGNVIWGRVEGLKAQKLEVKALFITCLEHHLEDLIRSVEKAGVEVIDVVAAPIAASFVTLSKKQKKAGCLLVNIGSETLSIMVFENSTPVSLEVFPIGSTDITHDIALGLKISIEDAENVKVGTITRSTYSRKKLDEIINARLSDMFELIEKHLKKIGRNALLPAGVVLSGGGSGLSGIRELAESTLKLPAKIAEVHFGDEDKTKSKDPLWAVASGLAIVGFNADGEQQNVGTRSIDDLKRSGADVLKGIGGWIKRFLP